MTEKTAAPVRKKQERATPAEMLRNLAWFRYQLRRFLRFSEKAARKCGVTPQHHQLLLGVAGFTGRNSANLSELADFLQERHNAVVGLVERAAVKGLVRKAHDPRDRRVVIVTLTALGARKLAKLSRLHHEEVVRVQAGMLAAAGMRRSPASLWPLPGARPARRAKASVKAAKAASHGQSGVD